MYEARVTVYFSAAHYLKDYPGNCARIHGHNWKVEAAVRSETLDSLGFVMDFRELKKHLKEITNELDHSLINEHKDFSSTNPSSENIAKWIYLKIKDRVNSDRCLLYSIEVAETQDSSVTYYGK